jgi:hypothetical protein
MDVPNELVLQTEEADDCPRPPRLLLAAGRPVEAERCEWS